MSEEIKFNIIHHSCLELLLYGIDALSLKPFCIQKLSVANNIAVKRCFNLSHSSVYNILYFMNCLPISIVLDIRKILLINSSTKSTSDIVRLCGLIRNNDDNIVELCYKYDVHYSMASPLIKSCIVEIVEIFYGRRTMSYLSASTSQNYLSKILIKLFYTSKYILL